MDIIAKRYGKLPHEVKSISLSDYQFNVLVASKAIEEENNQIKKSQREQERKMRSRKR